MVVREAVKLNDEGKEEIQMSKDRLQYERPAGR